MIDTVVGSDDHTTCKVSLSKKFIKLIKNRGIKEREKKININFGKEKIVLEE